MIFSAVADRKRRKVIMLGLRGFPNVQGGVEAHVAALSSRFAERGWDVEVLGRRPYVPPGTSRIRDGVTMISLWAPRSTYLEAIVHTMIGVLVASRRSPDILHIHAIGPGLMAPLARLLGLRTVVTHHGFDYERRKWGIVARTALRLGERVGMRFAQGRIAVSRLIAKRVREECGVAATYVPNGVEVRKPPESAARLAAYGLTERRYIVSVARIVSEKGQLDLIRAFAHLADMDVKLALVGGAEYDSPYLREVREAAAATPGVVMTGVLTGDALAQVFAHAGVFALPSTHEGMPIALLEALGYGLPVVASDIPANLAVGLRDEDYVPVGDVDRLATILREKIANGWQAERAEAQVKEVQSTYDWSGIAEATLAVYGTVLAPEPVPTGPVRHATPDDWIVDGGEWVVNLSRSPGIEEETRADQ